MSQQQARASSGDQLAHQRLEHLYEISKLFASFESVEQTFHPALAIAMRTLALRSAILMEGSGGSKMHVWPSEDQSSVHMGAARQHLEAAYRSLVGAASTDDGTDLGPEPHPVNGFVVIPLVVAHRPAFGALQLEGAEHLDATDLIFVNAIANQLALTLDRDRAWRREVRIREELLAVVSHDLRNPLGTILMTADALERDGVLPQVVGRIQRSAKRMLRLIEDLLDFASIEAGRLAIRRQPEDAGWLIKETLASFEGVAQVKGVELTAEVPPQLPKIYCDRDRILQVLSNLVGNATTATSATERPHITLRVEARGHEVRFAVSDDGPGIGEDDLKHLFERYWRSEEAGYKGTGLGLAIASGIVGAHGGRLWAESELGRGATFIFTIPTADVTFLFTTPAPDEG